MINIQVGNKLEEIDRRADDYTKISLDLQALNKPEPSSESAKQTYQLYIPFRDPNLTQTAAQNLCAELEKMVNTLLTLTSNLLYPVKHIKEQIEVKVTEVADLSHLPREILSES